MSDTPEYTPPKVWTWDTDSGGAFANINRPVAGPTHEAELPVGEHPPLSHAAVRARAHVVARAPIRGATLVGDARHDGAALADPAIMRPALLARSPILAAAPRGDPLQHAVTSPFVRSHPSGPRCAGAARPSSQSAAAARPGTPRRRGRA